MLEAGNKPEGLKGLRVLVAEDVALNRDLLGDDPEGDALVKVVAPFYENLEAFNEKHANAVLEPEE